AGGADPEGCRFEAEPGGRQAGAAERGTWLLPFLVGDSRGWAKRLVTRRQSRPRSFNVVSDIRRPHFNKPGARRNRTPCLDERIGARLFGPPRLLHAPSAGWRSLSPGNDQNRADPDNNFRKWNQRVAGVGPGSRKSRARAVISTGRTRTAAA